MERATFGDVLRVTEFRVLLLAQSQSRVGDQLARVALAVLVFSQTSSATLTALVYALTYLPPLLTAPLLSGLADRYPRRTVMVIVDLVRAGLVAIMAIPGLPLLAVAALLVVLTCPQPLFSAARNATIPAILTGDRFPVGMSVVNTTDYVAQIAGFTIGGTVVALLGGPHVALGIDAITYLASAGLIRRGIGPHLPAGARSAAVRSETGQSVRARPAGGFAFAGVSVLARDRRLAGLAGLMWLYGFYLAPTALAAPYAHQVGASPAVVGLLMAADLPGAIIGALLLARMPPASRQRLMMPLAIATGLPLLATAAAPSLPVTVLLWACCGALSSYMTLAQVAIARAVPDALRARVVGLISAGLQTAQGLGVLLAGAIAAVLPPASSIAICAAAGSAGAIIIRLALRPAQEHRGEG
jgi:MFS family permease